MFNIISPQGNENWNYTHLDGFNLKKYNNECLQGCEEIGTFIGHWWECKWYQPHWKKSRGSSK
jgi:hypothetical protein